jgi:cytochrome c oxidase cbb3-type subunit 3
MIPIPSNTPLKNEDAMTEPTQDQSKEFAPPPGTEVHVYDGIVEHDNFLPRWWLGLLYGSIAFAALYFLYYQMGPGPTLVQEYEQSIQKRAVQLAANPTQEKDLFGDDVSLKAWGDSKDHITQGKTAYDAKCAVCHGQSGEGGIGPNLTDDFWIHGVRPTQMASTISKGVLDKGMPAWGSLLSTDETKSVIAYIRTLYGTSPANAKAPQGEKVAFE